MDDEQQAHDAFHWVRRTLFPRWRAGRRWQLVVGQPPGGEAFDGFCDRESHRVFIGRQVPAADLRLVIAHELTHAVVGLGHGARFCRRLRLAARAARRAGDQELARRLRDEAASLEAQPTLRAADVYARLRDLPLEAASFEAATRALARDVGLRPHELLRRYRRLRLEWDQALALYGGMRGHDASG